MTAACLPRLPWGLGLAGLIPFLALAGAAWLAPVAWQVIAIPAFLTYSAVILSFLGGVQWGVAMSLESDDSAGFRARLVLSMAPRRRVEGAGGAADSAR